MIFRLKRLLGLIWNQQLESNIQNKTPFPHITHSLLHCIPGGVGGRVVGRNWGEWLSKHLNVVTKILKRVTKKPKRCVAGSV